MAVRTIQEYIDRLDAVAKQHVQDFMEYMNAQYPQLHLKISFSMPMWMMGKKMTEGYIAISAAKNHYSIHFSDEDFLQELSAKLPACKTGKRCVNIKYGDEESLRIVKENIPSMLHVK